MQWAEVFRLLVLMVGIVMDFGILYPVGDPSEDWLLVNLLHKIGTKSSLARCQ
jgi:hypothetical protein